MTNAQRAAKTSNPYNAHNNPPTLGITLVCITATSIDMHFVSELMCANVYAYAYALFTVFHPLNNQGELSLCPY